MLAQEWMIGGDIDPTPPVMQQTPIDMQGQQQAPEGGRATEGAIPAPAPEMNAPEGDNDDVVVGGDVDNDVDNADGTDLGSIGGFDDADGTEHEIDDDFVVAQDDSSDDSDEDVGSRRRNPVRAARQ